MKRALAWLLALMVMITSLSGCGEITIKDGSETEKAGEIEAGEAGVSEQSSETTALRLIMYGDTTSRRDDFFNHDFHDKVLEELNIDLSVEWLPWSEMNGTVITNMLASGENIGFENIITLNDFHSKGYISEISEADIEKYMQNYIKMRVPHGFECAKYQGNIVSIPIGNKPYSGSKQALTIRNDLLKEVGYDAADIHTLSELEEAIAAVKAVYPNITVMRSVDTCLKYADCYDLTGMVTGQFVDDYTFVNELDESDEIFSYYESDYYKKCCEVMERWVSLGYVTQEYITNPGFDETEWNEGNCLLCYCAGYFDLQPSATELKFPEHEYAIIKLGDFPYTTTFDYDWGISFSKAAEKDIPYWLQLIDWIYKDQETYNFCVYGIQDQDWQYKEDGSIEKLVEDSFWDDWFLAANEYLTIGNNVSEERIDQYMNHDEGSKLSKLAGFVFDTSPVETEKALLDAVVSEYLLPITLGFVDYDGNFDAALEKLKEAGLDKYVEEYQRQYSEWYATNK